MFVLVPVLLTGVHAISYMMLKCSLGIILSLAVRYAGSTKCGIEGLDMYISPLSWLRLSILTYSVLVVVVSMCWHMFCTAMSWADVTCGGSPMA